MPDHPLLDDALTTLDAVEAVARAGEAALMPHFRHLEPQDVDEKAKNDLVSVADRASEAAILAAIRDRFPDHAILAEESGEIEGEDPRAVWIVDPIDGTTNFVSGMAHFSVSVALALDGELAFGVILDPAKGDCFRAARGRGASWNGAPCHVTGRPSLSGAVVGTGFPFKSHELLDEYLAIFKDVFMEVKSIRRPGSAALDLAYVAAGIFDGFFEFGLSAWDVAAGTLLVREAGGVVTDMAGEHVAVPDGHLVCGPAGVHRALLERVQRHHGAS